MAGLKPEMNANVTGGRVEEEDDVSEKGGRGKKRRRANPLARRPLERFSPESELAYVHLDTFPGKSLAKFLRGKRRQACLVFRRIPVGRPGQCKRPQSERGPQSPKAEKKREVEEDYPE